MTMSWTPLIAGNVQNNFIISWHESNVSQTSAKAEKFRFSATRSIKKTVISAKRFRGFRTDFRGSGRQKNAAGDCRSERRGDRIRRWGRLCLRRRRQRGRACQRNGLAVDGEGNIIGVANNRKLVYDDNNNVIGYVNPDGTMVDVDGNVNGRMLPDGTVVDNDGNVIGKSCGHGLCL